MEGYGPTQIEKLLPAYTQVNTAGNNPATTPEQDLLGGAATSPENYDHQLQYAVDASPVHQNAAQAPPFLIMHGTGDRMVPPEQSAALHTHLVQAGRSPPWYSLRALATVSSIPGKSRSWGQTFD